MSTIHALVSGRPGAGKTTAVKRACELLRQQGFAVYGFYTEEVRQNRIRVGFDVVAVPSGERSMLARVDPDRTAKRSADHVGSYRVDLRSFEEASTKALTGHRLTDYAVTVIDEIGKMELKSVWFGEEVRRIFDSPKSVVLATVPGNMAAAETMPLVRQLVRRHDVRLFKITDENRDAMPNELAVFLKTSLTSKN